jgi:polyhydroxybutyrate depolymerase
MHHLVVRGANRVFLVHMPPHPSAAMRLVVDFHGAGSDMHQQDIYSGFDPVADAHGFVVASPNGADAAIRQWRYFNDDDTSFAVAIVRELALHACVDPAHAYAVGISSGAGMTASLACQASDTFAGFGPVAADVYFPALCAKAKVRPIIIFHGTADPVVPYYGGHIGGPNGLRIAPAEQTAAAWAKHNGCTAGAAQTRLSSQVVTLTWKGCKAPVVMYRIVGGGHTWPGSAIELPALGLTTHQVSADVEIVLIHRLSEDRADDQVSSHSRSRACTPPSVRASSETAPRSCKRPTVVTCHALLDGDEARLLLRF